jgi:pimeloyl-ACP methyl ester carboxylesterase
LHQNRRGSGPRLLFLNGSGATLESSAPLIDAFVDRFDVLAYDQRGIGASLEEGADLPPYAMADLAGDAIGLLDAAGWETARVFGVSFGGMVAQELAVTAPSRIERLALFCTSSGGAGGASYPLHELVSLEPSERAARSVTLLDERFSPGWLANHNLDRAIVDMFAARALEPRSPARRHGELAQLEARRHHDVWDRLGTIDCPTFIGAGRFDAIAPVVNSEHVASRISGAELHVYEGGHPFWVQDPTALPDVFAFLGQ